MTIPTPTVTLTQDGNDVVLSSPPPGYNFQPDLAQTVGRTAAGNWYVYDKNVEARILILPLVINDTEKTNLIAFIRTNLDGAVNTFTYTDHLGVAHTGCRLRNPSPRYDKTPGQQWRVTLEIITTDDVG